MPVVVGPHDPETFKAVCVDPVVDFCEAMEVQSSFAPIPAAGAAAEPADSGAFTGNDSEREVAGHDPYVEDLGVRYSPADDERCDSDAPPSERPPGSRGAP